MHYFLRCYLLNLLLDQLETDLVNMAHIKEPPSTMKMTIDSVYSDLKKESVMPVLKLKKNIIKK